MFNVTFKSYHKNNKSIRYVIAFSNYPFSTKNTLAYNISKSLSSLSSNDDIYKEKAEYYKMSLAESGYKNRIKIHY